MSRIDELIAEHCPNGVQHLAIGDIARTVAGLSGKTKSDFTDGNSRFASYKNIFANPSLNLVSEDFVKVGPGEKQNALRRGDVLITGSSESVEEVGMSAVVTSEPTEPIYVNSFCFIVRFDDPTMLDPDFAKHVFRSLNIRKQIQKCASGVTRINISKPRFLKVRIPVPSLEVQREIVRVLDTFSKMEAELEAELEARKQQYEHYRAGLFGSMDLAETLALSDIAEFKYGYTTKATDSGAYRFIRITDISDAGTLRADGAKFIEQTPESDSYLVKPGDLLMARTGATFGKTVIVKENQPPAVYASFLIRVRFSGSRLLPSYYWHFAQSTLYWDQANALVSSGGQPQFNANALKKVRVPIPDIIEQRRIVEILDKFDALVNDLSVGLPAELAARRQQYEYHRDKLLTFRELEPAS